MVCSGEHIWSSIAAAQRRLPPLAEYCPLHLIVTLPGPVVPIDSPTRKIPLHPGASIKQYVPFCPPDACVQETTEGEGAIALPVVKLPPLALAVIV